MVQRHMLKISPENMFFSTCCVRASMPSSESELDARSGKFQEEDISIVNVRRVR